MAGRKNGISNKGPVTLPTLSYETTVNKRDSGGSCEQSLKTAAVSPGGQRPTAGIAKQETNIWARTL